MSILLPIARGQSVLSLSAAMANRHGLVAGATGTGKTVTLQAFAESLSGIGVPVFATDVKGDLSGIGRPGGDSPRIDARLRELGLTDRTPAACPVELWDVFGEQGTPARTTVSDMGPLLFSRLLGLTDVQSGVLSIAFRVADDEGLLLLDLKDLRAMVQHVGDHAPEYRSTYGQVSGASVGAIQRALLTLEESGGDVLFGEPALDLADLMRIDGAGHGVVNLLAADRLFQSPRAYAAFLLWLLAELYETLPEVGDLEKPKLVLFFDEAHLLFDDAPAVLLERIEQVVRLIRSKGVGVFFVTQNPLDVPDTVLGQLGNRVQHALRAFTPRDQKAVKAAATTFRTNPQLDVARVITELAVGEALVSFLDESGTPAVVERAFIVPPRSHIGAISPNERHALRAASGMTARYGTAVDRESAYERLKSRTEEAAPRPPSAPRSRTPRSRESAGEVLAKSTVRSIGYQVGRELVRGVLGSLLGGRRRR